MPHDPFDPEDLDALRRLTSPSSDRRPADGRRLRSPETGEPRTTQLNVRVRQAIKDKAYEIARRRRCSMADVIELAVEELYQGGAHEQPPAIGERQ